MTARSRKRCKDERKMLYIGREKARVIKTGVKREVKKKKKKHFQKQGENLGFTERKRRMPLYNLECLYSNKRSELCSPKNAAISALSHPPCLDKGKRHPGKSHCRAWELHKS